MKKILPLLLLVLLCTAFKPSHILVKTISGTVTEKATGKPLAGVSVVTLPGNYRATTDKNGKYRVTIIQGDRQLRFTFIGFNNEVINISKSTTVNVALTQNSQSLTEVVVVGAGTQKKSELVGSQVMIRGYVGQAPPLALTGRVAGIKMKYYDQPTEENYAAVKENGFRSSLKNPLSTFSIDVDAASYSNIRRFINNGGLPPTDAVRIEEMVNYFDYEYPQPLGKDPVNIITEISNAPWNSSHKLVKVALQGKKIPTAKLPASNLVFLIDASGSMNQANKLPLLVSSFKMLTEQLRSTDKVAIVVYAGNAGLVLPATPGDQKIKIKEALNQLSAGGSTAGGQGINLAYKVAAENFIKGGNNRVILATDGDFNVGASSDNEMERLIEEKRKSGIFLTTLGFGMGNYKDSKLEILADKGNGNYAYIDNISEARKVLISEFGGTLYTIAKDVKLQIEFNPAKAQAYRLIGYENRLLKSRDFNDDTKDAGEMGSGHTVTALYEVIPAGIKSSFAGSVDELKYQENTKPVKHTNNAELMTVKLRYKEPDGNTSKLISKVVMDTLTPLNNTSNNFKFSAAVAEFGMLLSQSDYKQGASFDNVIHTAQLAIGKDQEGYRSEFIKLAKSAKLLAKDLLGMTDKNSFDEKK